MKLLRRGPARATGQYRVKRLLYHKFGLLQLGHLLLQLLGDELEEHGVVVNSPEDAAQEGIGPVGIHLEKANHVSPAPSIRAQAVELPQMSCWRLR